MQIELKLDDKKLQQGFVNIKKAQRIATAKTLNTIAFLSRKNAIKNIQDEYILRNNYTINNIKVTPHTDMRYAIRNMKSIMGATDKISYMRLHEEGGYKKPKRGSSLAIAQLAARGGSKRRLVSKNVYLKKIQKSLVKWPKHAGSKKSKLIAMAYVAFETKKFIIYKKNIYKITSFNKSRRSISFKKKHIYNISQRHAKIKSNKWMWPAIQKPIQDSQNIYNWQISRLLRQEEII